MPANKVAFTTEKMAELNPEGFELYQQAESNPSAEYYFKAGEAYDRSYESRWGDYIFAGSTWQEFIQNLGLSPTVVRESDVKKLMLTSQESLVISCECYIKALQQDPNHYFANLHLATALTAALQVEASIPYWAKALKLKVGDTVRALVADSQGPNNKGVATKLVTEYLGLGQLNYTSLLFNPDTRVYGEIAVQADKALDIFKSLVPESYKQVSIQSYQEQKKLAKNLLVASPLLQSNIQYLKDDKSGQSQQQQRTNTQNFTPNTNTSSQVRNVSSSTINQDNQKKIAQTQKFETPFPSNNQNLNEEFKASEKNQLRPKEITRACIFGFVTTPICMLLAFLPITQSIGTWYPPFLFFVSLFSFLSFFGMWMMKKWGVYTYTFLFALVQVVLLGQGVWNFSSIIIPVIIILNGFKHLSKMS